MVQGFVGKMCPPSVLTLAMMNAMKIRQIHTSFHRLHESNWILNCTIITMFQWYV